jgi:hypothetical protein
MMDWKWSWLNQILACPVRIEDTHENIQAGSYPGRESNWNHAN